MEHISRKASTSESQTCLFPFMLWTRKVLLSDSDLYNHIGSVRATDNRLIKPPVPRWIPVGLFTPPPALSAHCAASEPVSSSRIFQQRHYGGRQLVLSGQLCPFISLPGTAVIKRNEETGSNSEARNHSSVSFTSFSASSLLPDSVSVTSPPSLFTSISSLLSLSLSLSIHTSSESH